MKPVANPSRIWRRRRRVNPGRLLRRRRRVNLRNYYRRLRAHFGHQHWWPGDTPFEVCVGAILTQNTAWSNVEKAIYNLKRARALSPRALHRLSEREIAALIKPSGYFNIKARRLKAFIEFLFAEYGGSVARMAREDLATLRLKLLAVKGVGPETADSILLYALGKPVFVVDAYTRRVLIRHHLIKPTATYDKIQKLFHSSLHPPRSTFFNDFHAQFVAVGKIYCKSRVALCECCPLKPFLSLLCPAKRRMFR
jgi:endonuclease-3 related protein